MSKTGEAKASATNTTATTTTQQTPIRWVDDVNLNAFAFGLSAESSEMNELFRRETSRTSNDYASRFVARVETEHQQPSAAETRLKELKEEHRTLTVQLAKLKNPARAHPKRAALVSNNLHTQREQLRKRLVEIGDEMDQLESESKKMAAAINK